MADEPGAVEDLVNRSFWKDRRALVTGHTGFKGSWLAVWLAQLGAEVHGYSLPPPTDPSLFVDADVAGVLASDTRADVRDLKAITDTIRRVQPEVVFHMAAQSLVRQSYAEPIDTFAINIIGTANVLNAVAQVASVRAAIMVTSDKCYDNAGSGQAYRETHPMGGHDPYSASKGCAELVVASYRASLRAIGAQGDPQIASVRSGNVVGGGDWSNDRLLPDCVRSFTKGEAVLLRYPGAVRPWLHVLEPLSGYIRVAEKLCEPDGTRYATAFNFGPDDANDATVQTVAETVACLWGPPAEVKVLVGEHAPEAMTLRLDASRAKSMLGWKACWNFETTLDRTVAWYKACHSGKDARTLMVRQIADFEASA